MMKKVLERTEETGISSEIWYSESRNGIVSEEGAWNYEKKIQKIV